MKAIVTFAMTVVLLASSTVAFASPKDWDKEIQAPRSEIVQAP